MQYKRNLGVRLGVFVCGVCVCKRNLGVRLCVFVCGVSVCIIAEELYNSFPEAEAPKEKEKNKKVKFAGSLKT